MLRHLLVPCFVAAAVGHLAAGAELTALVEARRWQKALPIAEAAVKSDGNDADAVYQLSRIRRARGELDAALALAERAAALQPRNAAYRVQVAAVVGDQAQQASIFRQPGLARRVKREAEAALALDPNHLGALEMMMGFYREAPSIMGGDKAQATVLLERIRTLSPADAIMADADQAAEAKQTSRVAELYRSAVAAGPAHYGARLALTNHLLAPATRNLAEAESHARELVKLNANRADSHSALTFALAAQKKLADLDAALTAAEAGIPENLYPGYRAGIGLLDASADLARAEALFRKYLGQPVELGYPSHAAAYWRLGLVLEKQGRKADAVAALRQAVSADPKLDQAKADLRRLQ
jgi:tetratricopeptide (TPR) repeat protein